MVTQDYATGLAFVVIACCGRGPAWGNAVIGLFGIYLMLRGEAK